MTRIYWASNYNPKSVFYNYPKLTTLQNNVLLSMFNSVQEYKSRESDGNLFPTLP